MMQQINLYQDEFRPRAAILTSGQTLLGLGVVLGLLLMVSAYQGWRNQQLDAELAAAREALRVSEARLAEVRKSHPPRQPDPALARAVAGLERQLERKRQVLAMLSGKTFGNTEGFVPQLTGLARQRIEGLWLTGLRLHAGGTRLDMEGNALKPELLPRYLQRLANEPVFAGTQFETFRLERPKQQPRWIRFQLRSAASQPSAEAGS